MPLWDSADLLARCVRAADRPATDQATTSPDWYAFLTEAQSEWLVNITAIAPSSQYGAPVPLVSSDGGHTYDFPPDTDGDPIFPMGEAELRATRGGQLLMPCADWNDAGDFVPEGTRIRIPGGRARSFAGGGPWARFATPSGLLDGTHAPALRPKHARILLVHRACANWARKGGRMDPQPFLDKEAEAWFGNPGAGVHGLLTMYKTQFAFGGNEALRDNTGEVGNAWWRGMRTD